jgi:HEAT repeat protein
MNADNDLEHRLRSQKTEDRIHAVKQVVRSESPEKQRLLLEALHDRSPYVAAMAAESLGEIADDRAAEAMVTRFEELSRTGPKGDPGCQIRANLAFSLGRLEYRHAGGVLRMGIRTIQIEPIGGVPFDTAAHLRGNCALALAYLRDPESVRDIALLLFDRSGYSGQGVSSDPNLKVEPRKAAARALALTGSVTARLPLTLRLVHPENEVAEVLQECMTALVELEDPQAVEVLQSYLRHRDQALAAYAALMIARTRAPEAARLLADTALRFSGDTLKAVLLALTTLRTADAAAALNDLAHADRDEIRCAVVSLLPLDAAGISLLQTLAAKDPSPKVRSAARLALTAR